MRDWIQEAWSVLGGDRSVGDPRRLIGRATAVMIRINELEAELARIRPGPEPLHPDIAKGIPPLDIAEAFKNRPKT